MLCGVYKWKSHLINMNHWDSFPLCESVIWPRERAFARLCVKGDLEHKKTENNRNPDTKDKGDFFFLVTVGYLATPGSAT